MLSIEFFALLFKYYKVWQKFCSLHEQSILMFNITTPLVLLLVKWQT